MRKELRSNSIVIGLYDRSTSRIPAQQQDEKGAAHAGEHWNEARWHRVRSSCVAHDSGTKQATPFRSAARCRQLRACSTFSSTARRTQRSGGWGFTGPPGAARLSGVDWSSAKKCIDLKALAAALLPERSPHFKTQGNFPFRLKGEGAPPRFRSRMAQCIAGVAARFALTPSGCWESGAAAVAARVLPPSGAKKRRQAADVCGFSGGENGARVQGGEYERLSAEGKRWLQAQLDPSREWDGEALAGARRLHASLAAHLGELFYEVAESRGLEGQDILAVVETGMQVAWGACLAVGDGHGLTPELARLYVLNRTLSLWRWALRAVAINPRVPGRGYCRPIEEPARRCRYCRCKGALWEVQERSQDSVRVIALCSRCRHGEDQEHPGGGQRGRDPGSGGWYDDTTDARKQLLRSRFKRRWDAQ